MEIVVPRIVVGFAAALAVSLGFLFLGTALGFDARFFAGWFSCGVFLMIWKGVH